MANEDGGQFERGLRFLGEINDDKKSVMEDVIKRLNELYWRRRSRQRPHPLVDDADEVVHCGGTPDIHIGVSADFMAVDELSNEFNCNPKNKLIWKSLMENDESKEQINLSIEAEDGQVEIVHRYGAAKEIQEPQRVHITGSIESPAEYFEAREDTEHIDKTKAHLEVWKDKGKMSLLVDPSSPIGTKVVGEMKMKPALANMNINNFGQAKYNETDFVLLLKESRPLFDDQKVCMDIVDKVKNIQYKVDQKIERNDDERGSKRELFEQTVESELPDSFQLDTNIFVGSSDEGKNWVFSVDIKYHYKHGGLHFWLESQGLQEIKDDIMDDILEKQIDVFADEIPVIYK